MNREKWVDVARCLGIYAIYLLHMGENIESAYFFFFKFVVALFFFLAGCTETYQKELSFVDYARLKVKRILLPTYMFVFLVVLVQLIQDENIMKSLGILRDAFIYGERRNLPYVGTLWFFTCLFVIQLFFRLLLKLKNKWIILVVSVVFLMISEFALPHRPIIDPRWAWNVDSAMFYLFYFALGYVLYPYLKNWFLLDTKKKKTTWIIVFLISAIYTLAVFGHGESILMERSESFARVFSYPVSIELNLLIISPLLIIVCVLCVSKLLENLQFLNTCGRETLYLCGNESILKDLVPYFISLFGLELRFTNPISAYFYCFLLLFFACKYIIPVQRKIVSRFEKHLFK